MSMLMSYLNMEANTKKQKKKQKQNHGQTSTSCPQMYRMPLSRQVQTLKSPVANAETNHD